MVSGVKCVGDLTVRVLSVSGDMRILGVGLLEVV